MRMERGAGQSAMGLALMEDAMRVETTTVRFYVLSVGHNLDESPRISLLGDDS